MGAVCLGGDLEGGVDGVDAVMGVVFRIWWWIGAGGICRRENKSDISSLVFK